MNGIAYRGKSLYECNARLPKAPPGEAALPEAAFWLLLTGEAPTDAECKAFTDELHSRSDVPANVMTTIDSLPIDTHPMTQLSVAMLALQKDSKFAKQYNAGMKKGEYWEYTLEDAVDLVAKIPVVAAKIYRRTFKDGNMLPYDKNTDWATNYAQMLGVSSDEKFKEVTRLYLMLHADHEGGNVSAHTTHLVGSALSDPYSSWAAGLCGLAGPLHGLANQECLRWLKQTQATLGGKEPTVEIITQLAKDTLAAGKVVPGFGHGVLRKTDPRYTIQHSFAAKNFPDDPLFRLANVCFEAIPPVLQATGKVKNPWPNVDALSGTCMQYYGLNQEDYYTVVFAVSRSLGCMANLVWSRMMGLPIERPKSTTLDVLKEKAKI